ncbi:hypothetical protein BG015_008169 [Linnemannia schmuckeri]|uniref:Uncharacterized protein n=1 Tax=Linnemannia schmuckeri TaxID=64567 RepID=A0A9P5S0X1_9FUNG|nr:hypothetical protein BG015_008169 [Linnemannia schmuckeri]
MALNPQQGGYGSGATGGAGGANGGGGSNIGLRPFVVTSPTSAGMAVFVQQPRPNSSSNINRATNNINGGNSNMNNTTATEFFTNLSAILRTDGFQSITVIPDSSATSTPTTLPSRSMTL